MFTTSNLFYVSSPWIVLLSGAMTYALSFFSDHIYQSLQLFALSFGLGILFQLLTLAATPFAVVRLLRAGVPHLRRIDIVARVNRTDWNAIAQSGLHCFSGSIGHKSGANPFGSLPTSSSHCCPCFSCSSWFWRMPICFHPETNRP
jgi:hypothetical protein